MERVALRKALTSLKAAYGPPGPPPLSDPWQCILWENIAYLANDERRAKAFASLRARIGLAPQELLDAPADALLEAASAGILAGSRVDRIRECAELVLDEFGGELAQILEWPVPKARKALQKFPGIGGPGADKILLFCGRDTGLALESNGLRVLLRLGFGEDTGNYSASYRTVQQSIGQELPESVQGLIEAHQLLRRHGQEVCKSSRPKCEDCSLSSECAAFERWGGGQS